MFLLAWKTDSWTGRKAAAGAKLRKAIVTAKGKVLTSCTLNPEDNPGNEQGARAMQEIEWNKMNMLDLLQEEGELRTTEWDSLCRERHGLTKGKVETYRRELVDSGEVTHRRDGITHYYSRPIAIPKIA